LHRYLVHLKLSPEQAVLLHLLTAGIGTTRTKADAGDMSAAGGSGHEPKDAFFSTVSTQLRHTRLGLLLRKLISGPIPSVAIS
jgi:hypothetical protein